MEPLQGQVLEQAVGQLSGRFDADRGGSFAIEADAEATITVDYLENTNILRTEFRGEGGDWAFEIKWDGYRTIAHIADGRVRLQSTAGHDVTDRWPEFAGLPGAVNTFLASPDLAAGLAFALRPLAARPAQVLRARE